MVKVQKNTVFRVLFVLLCLKIVILLENGANKAAHSA